MKSLQRIFVIASLMLSSACVASSPYMRQGVEFAPTPVDKARIVFLRPSSRAFGIRLTIVDANGHYMGDALPSSRYAIDIPAGEYLLIAWGEGTHSLRANVAAGKTYYVEVEPHMGAWSARFHLIAIKPNTEAWGEVQKWMDESIPLAVDVQEGQTYVDSRQEDLQDVITKGTERFRDYDAEEAEERTLNPDDGV